MVGKVLTGNGITRWEKGTYALVGGSITVRVLTRARGRCECCEAHEHQRALDVDHIVPRNQSGTGNLSNLQALCFRCNADKRKAGCVFCALEGSGLVLLENELVLCIAAADLLIKGQAMSFQSCPPRAMGSCQVQR